MFIDQTLLFHEELFHEEATGESPKGHCEGEPIRTYSEENLAICVCF